MAWVTQQYPTWVRLKIQRPWQWIMQVCIKHMCWEEPKISGRSEKVCTNGMKNLCQQGVICTWARKQLKGRTRNLKSSPILSNSYDLNISDDKNSWLHIWKVSMASFFRKNNSTTSSLPVLFWCCWQLPSSGPSTRSTILIQLSYV